MNKVAWILILALATTVAAKEPWERRDAVAEANRVLKLAVPMLAESERGDPRPAVKALQDPSWALRLLACDRLESHKIDPEVVAALRRECGPGKTGPTREDPDWKSAWEFADAVEVGGIVPTNVDRSAALQSLVTVILLRLRDGVEQNRRAVLEAVLPYTQLVDGPTQRWIAKNVAQFFQPRALLNDLGAKSLKEALGERGRRVLAWYAARRDRFVWDPRAKGFRLGPE